MSDKPFTNITPLTIKAIDKTTMITNLNIVRYTLDCTPAVRQIGLGQLARVYGF